MALKTIPSVHIPVPIPCKLSWYELAGISLWYFDIEKRQKLFQSTFLSIDINSCLAAFRKTVLVNSFPIYNAWATSTYVSIDVITQESIDIACLITQLSEYHFKNTFWNVFCFINQFKYSQFELSNSIVNRWKIANGVLFKIKNDLSKHVQQELISISIKSAFNGSTLTTGYTITKPVNATLTHTHRDKITERKNTHT